MTLTSFPSTSVWLVASNTLRSRLNQILCTMQCGLVSSMPDQLALIISCFLNMSSGISLAQRHLRFVLGRRLAPCPLPWLGSCRMSDVQMLTGHLMPLTGRASLATPSFSKVLWFPDLLSSRNLSHYPQPKLNTKLSVGISKISSSSGR